MDKYIFNNQLQSMSNPMQNLFSVMKGMIINMGCKDYAEALQQLDEAEKLMRKAIDTAQKITYEIK